ncbi:MAG TPA: hypothetical protein VMT15_10620 [Bryobacteraceae bacterium]|nr:hypothetical protein [Bryobacteraceae bacterium]
MRGGASAEVINYSALAEDLASHGYFVVGFDAPGLTHLVVFPDGRTVARAPENDLEAVSGPELNRRAQSLLDAWTADIGHVLERLERWNIENEKFAGRLNMMRVGVFGHSFGGATSAKFCAQDPRCTAGVDIDGALFGSVLREGIHKPFLFLLSGKGDFSSPEEVRRFEADIQSVYDRLPPDGRLRLSIRGTNHFMFSDDGALLKSQLVRGVLRTFGMLGLDGRRQLAVTAYCVSSFFDAYLKGAGSSLPPNIPSPLYPEVQAIAAPAAIQR